MKNVKFRIYDEEIADMVQIGQLDITDGSCRRHLFVGDYYDYWNKVELMQFTGIYDYYGKEIYEGDIVHRLIYKENEIFIGEVKMLEGTWCIVDYRKQKTIPLWTKVDANRVIGNIYENKHLLGV